MDPFLSVERSGSPVVIFDIIAHSPVFVQHFHEIFTGRNKTKTGQEIVLLPC